MESEDREFLERILAGEPEVFELLVRKYHRMAGAIAYAIVGDFHLAEDISQEAFLKAFRALETVRQPERFRFWLAGLVRSRALDVLRQRRAHAAVPLEGSAASSASGAQVSRGVPFAARRPAGESPVEEEEMRRETQQKIREAIDQLPEQDRLVIVLKHLEGLSYKEIAELLGTSTGAVESRLFRARQALRSKLPAGRL